MARKDAFQLNKDLYEFHELGKFAINITGPTADEFDKMSFSEVCFVTKKSPNEVSKARQFAQLYNDRQLKWLCSLGQKVGRPLTKSHICRLVVVRDDKQRDRLAKECAEESWSVERLGREISKIQPKAGYGGRQPKLPETLDELLGEIETLTSRWIKFHRVLGEFHAGFGKKRAPRKTLPPGITNRMSDIATLMRELQQEIKLETGRIGTRRIKKGGSGRSRKKSIK